MGTGKWFGWAVLLSLIFAGVALADSPTKEDPVKKGMVPGINVYDADVRDVIRMLGEIGEKNLVMDKGVSGKVTLFIEKPVHWESVLDTILKMNRLEKEYFGEETIRIFPKK